MEGRAAVVVPLVNVHLLLLLVSGAALFGRRALAGTAGAGRQRVGTRSRGPAVAGDDRSCHARSPPAPAPITGASRECAQPRGITDAPRGAHGVWELGRGELLGEEHGKGVDVPRLRRFVEGAAGECIGRGSGRGGAGCMRDRHAPSLHSLGLPLLAAAVGSVLKVLLHDGSSGWVS